LDTRKRQENRENSLGYILKQQTAAKAFPLNELTQNRPSNSGLEVVLPNGLVVRVPAGFEPLALLRLLDTLGDRSC
jgi:hypothetical protein